MRSSLALAALLAFPAILVGCATGSNGCSPMQLTLTISPATATIDHDAAAPENREQFRAAMVPSGMQSGCAAPASIALVLPAWTASDSVNVQIDSAQDSTNGVATCLGPTTAPVKLTATYGTGANVKTATALLTCK